MISHMHALGVTKFLDSFYGVSKGCLWVESVGPELVYLEQTIKIACLGRNVTRASRC